MPTMRDLCEINAKKLQNVEALAAIRGLRSLQAVGCGRPLDKGLRALLQTRGIEHRDIAFA